MNSRIQLAKPVRLGNEVYDVLLKQLMSLEIKPGERIGVDKLARDLGVSQTPIREALTQLEAQGLVVKVHLSGYRAAPQLTRKQFDDLCELRLLLEPAAAAKAAELMSAGELDDIVALTKRMTEPAPGDPQSAYNAFAQNDARFHAAIAKASQNELLYDVISHQRVHLHLFRLQFYARVTQDAVVEHAKILEAFRRKEPAAAAAAMRSHIETAHARFKDVYKSYDP
jgi:DNA-binding GntR family transcriptional regulator